MSTIPTTVNSIFFSEARLLAATYAWVGEPHLTARVSKFSAAVTRSPLYWLEIQRSVVQGLGEQKYRSILERIVFTKVAALEEAKSENDKQKVYQIVLKCITDRITPNFSLKLGWMEDARNHSKIPKEDYNVLNMCRLIPDADSMLKGTNARTLTEQVQIARLWTSSKLFSMCFPVPRIDVSRFTSVPLTDARLKTGARPASRDTKNFSKEQQELRQKQEIKARCHFGPKEFYAFVDQLAEDTSLYYNRQAQVTAIFQSLRDRHRTAIQRMQTKSDSSKKVGCLTPFRILSVSTYLQEEDEICSLDLHNRVSIGFLSDPFFSTCTDEYRVEFGKSIVDAGGVFDCMKGFEERVKKLSGDHLENLKADHLGLTLLPSRFCQLTTLTHLDLQHNLLETLPNSIGQCIKLKQLFLSHNRLCELPEEIGKLKELEMLDVQDNHLERLPAGIGGLVSLRELNVHKQKNKDLILPEQIGLLALQKFGVENVHFALRQIKEFGRRDRRALANLAEVIRNLEQIAAWDLATQTNLTEELLKARDIIYKAVGSETGKFLFDLYCSNPGAKVEDYIRLVVPSQPVRPSLIDLTWTFPPEKIDP